MMAYGFRVRWNGGAFGLTKRIGKARLLGTARRRVRISMNRGVGSFVGILTLQGTGAIKFLSRWTDHSKPSPLRKWASSDDANRFLFLQADHRKERGHRTGAMRFPFFNREKRVESSYTTRLLRRSRQTRRERLRLSRLPRRRLKRARAWWGRSFASASVSGRDAVTESLTPALLSLIGRSLIRRGRFFSRLPYRMGGWFFIPFPPMTFQDGPCRVNDLSVEPCRAVRSADTFGRPPPWRDSSSVCG